MKIKKDEVINWRIPLMTLTPGMKVHRMDMTLACMQDLLYKNVQSVFKCLSRL